MLLGCPFRKQQFDFFSLFVFWQILVLMSVKGVKTLNIKVLIINQPAALPPAPPHHTQTWSFLWGPSPPETQNKFFSMLTVHNIVKWCVMIL